MQIFSNKKAVLFAGTFAAIVAVAAGAFLLPNFYDENKRFEKQADEIFRAEMTANTLTMHYTLANPENFGITEYEAVLPCYSTGNSSAASSDGSTGDSASGGGSSAAGLLDRYLDDLSHISQTELSEDNLYTYRLLVRYLRQAQEGILFPYYDEPLSPASGMQSQLPVLLAEYTFRSRRDVEDYLSLLDQTDEYFASLALYEREKKDAGLLQADTTLSQVIDQCYSIVSKKELESGTHFLQTTFAERIDTLVQSGILTQAEADRYISENDRLLTTVLQPACEDLADALLILMGDGSSTPHGLAAFPAGREYYTYLVRSVTGSPRSIDEIKDLLYPQFEAEYRALRSLLTSRPDAAETWKAYMNDSVFPYQDVLSMLRDLQSRMRADFPPFPQETASSAETASSSVSQSAADGRPALTVKQVSDSLAPYCAPAFYLTPPLDNTSSNTIYINPLSTSGGLELYTTLAHEGYPGHLYQSVYSGLFMQQQDTNPIRQILWHGGYQEGWALYVELLSYDYACTLAGEKGLADAALAYEMEKHNRSMQLCLYSILDLSIHYDNAPYEQIHKVLQNFGISDPVTTRAIYDYIAEEPAVYLKYYLGYLEVLSLKEKAKTLWGEDYSDLRFHRFFLECGSSDFATLEEWLEYAIPPAQ